MEELEAEDIRSGEGERCTYINFFLNHILLTLIEIKKSGSWMSTKDDLMFLEYNN